MTLRLLSFYPSARVESRYTEMLLPFHGHVLASDIAAPSAMPQIEELDFDDLPPGLAEQLGWQEVVGTDEPQGEGPVGEDGEK